MYVCWSWFDCFETYLSFFSWNTMDGETSFNVIDQTEVFTSLFDGDNIYK